ncbi:unnamed protein product, partial [Choristocarpus tenellus]
MDPSPPDPRTPSGPVASSPNAVADPGLVKSEPSPAKSLSPALSVPGAVVPNILPMMVKGGVGGISGAPMFPMFPGMFTPAALAAAAAAASAAVSAGSASGPSTESMPRKSKDTRKRKRVSEVGEDDIKVEVGEAVDEATGVEVKGDSGAVSGGGTGGGTGGLGGMLWPGMGRLRLGIVTPEHQEAGMTGHERKERRKIRNRMSAQQHRERQRRHVETLEQCLREKDDQILSLKKQAQELEEKNKNLEERVQKLEAGEFPTLEDVLLGLDDTWSSESASHAPPEVLREICTNLSGVLAGDKDTEVGIKAKTRSRNGTKNHAAMPISSTDLSKTTSDTSMEITRVIETGLSVCSSLPLELDVEGEVTRATTKAPAIGVVGVEDSDEEVVTTDHAHSSSEEDSEDLLKLTTIYSSPMESSRGVGGRGEGGVITALPLSPSHDFSGEEGIEQGEGEEVPADHTVGLTRRYVVPNAVRRMVRRDCGGDGVAGNEELTDGGAGTLTVTEDAPITGCVEVYDKGGTRVVAVVDGSQIGDDPNPMSK